MAVENAKLTHTCTTIQEKYVNVAKRFHYLEDKMKRREVDRLTSEQNILTALERLQVCLFFLLKLVEGFNEIYGYIIY